MLFDLDDTIIAFDAVSEPAWRSVCAAYAPQVAGLTPAALQAAIDAARDAYWADPERHRLGRLNLTVARREIVGQALDDLGVDRPDLAAAIAAAYSAEREALIYLLPGAIETLQVLRNRGTPLALLTNGSAAGQRAKIERFDLAGYFDAILIEEEVGAGKPDERVYRRALEMLGARPGEATMVGDNLVWDVAGAARLGIGTVWVDAAGGGLPPDAPARPDRIVRRIRELV
jgi:putative hydrolase of the HAD superfamily